MTIAVGGDIGAMMNLRDALLDTQAIMTNAFKFPIAVSVWDQDHPLYDSPTGLPGGSSRPVKLKSIYPVANTGNGFVNDPRYEVTDMDGKVIMNGAVPKYTVDVVHGDIWIGAVPIPYPTEDTANPAFDATDFANRVGVVKFRVREAGAHTEYRAQIQDLSTVINTLTSVISVFQKQENAFLNSGAIS